jgi:hypothetical protein
MAELRTGRLVLDASAVVRIIEGGDTSAFFQEAVLNADLVLATAGLQQRLSRASELLDVIEPDRAPAG